MPLPEDWREWASDDPANHPDGCKCVDENYCGLQLDAYQWYANQEEKPDEEPIP